MKHRCAAGGVRARIYLTIAVCLLTMSHAAAQERAVSAYPAQPVKVIVTVSAGGGVDTVTRIVAEKLQQRWGQPVVVDNRAGGGGDIAGEAVFHSDPDGYTLLASPPNTITISNLLHKSINFDPAAFVPIAVMSEMPNVLLVRSDFPAKDAAEFLSYAKAHPGTLNYASQGIGTTSHLTAELFTSITGIKLVHVPYRGTAPALNDIIAGHVDLIFMELSSALKLHQAGKARILAVATEKRLGSLPDVPTLAEVGVPNCISDTWNAISAPPKTPQPILEKINSAIHAVLTQPEVTSRFRALTLTPVGQDLPATRRFVSEEAKRWSEVIRKAGIQPQ